MRPLGTGRVVKVKAFALKSEQLSLTPLSSHTKDFKNSIKRSPARRLTAEIMRKLNNETEFTQSQRPKKV